jgi:hypothetical protein
MHHINITLDDAEYDALQKFSRNEMRHPRDQARYMLRVALGLIERPPYPKVGAGHGDDQVVTK